ncbi:MAG: DNA translocase FtsK 4TM domain-containing protein [Lactobacillaceae bacterium]|jgi:S-DNA-T family DNA segregation ATPase FtsK/SpoIIIE|nr:DNA translocase FtsK 4TM domain-containing protein [Lactobacillaceae bacterium]
MAKKTEKIKKTESLFRETLYRLWGIMLLVFCALAVISVLSYNPTDSSFNVASSDGIKNILGSFGSYTADVILRSFGFALIVFVFAPLVWGYELTFGKERINYPTRVFAFIIGVISFSMFLAMLPDYIENFALGGVIGKRLSGKSLSFINSFARDKYTNLGVAGVFLVLSVLGFNYAAGITYKSWVSLVKYTIGFFKKIFSVLSYPFSKFRKGGEEVHERPKRKTKERVEPKLETSAPKKESVQIKKPAKVIRHESGYRVPDVGLLSKPEKSKSGNDLSQKDLENIALNLENVLQEFGVNGKIVKIRPGPVVTLYELEPAPGTKTARVIGLSDDIARSMSVSSVRIAVVPGSNTIGIEMPNKTRDIVWLRELIEDDNFTDSRNSLNIVLGKDIGGKNVYADLAKMPHLLVAGTTGSGKSVGINSMILSILYKMSPDECKMIMIDPKMLELSVYNDIPHLLTPVITDPGKAVVGLKWAVREMEDRYRVMAKVNVRNIQGYNKKLEELKESNEKMTRTIQTGFDEDGRPIYEEQELDLTPLPYIIVVVDEMADLMLVAGKEVEAAIQRLAQMARAAGIHLIMATQRPSVDVITGTIKANFPTRISFQVTSKIDSRTILGEQGAEQLLGMGDMLYMPAGLRPIRIHGSFVKDSEVERVVEFLKNQMVPEYVEGITEGELNDKGGAIFDNGSFVGGSDDDLYNQALAIVQRDKKASTSYIQRKLRIGYNRAASIIDRMEEEGIVTAADHVGRREVI